MKIRSFQLRLVLTGAACFILLPLRAGDQIAPPLWKPGQKGRLVVLAEAPAIPSLSAGGFAETPSFSTDFSTGLGSGWRVASWKQNGTLMSPERCRVVDGLLTLTVLPGEPFQGGSLQTTWEFGYGRWVARVKPSSVPGVLNSIFTKDWDDLTKPGSHAQGNKDEVDIEFLTHTFSGGRGEVHLAIHREGHTPLWSMDIPLDFDPSSDFRQWGFDILPDRVVWHVDGKELLTWKFTGEHHIAENYEFFFNAWTKKKWILGPPAEAADYHIAWVRFYPLQK